MEPFKIGRVDFNHRTVVIGLGYKARQGKNYIAERIASEFPGVVVTGFAAALKTYCRAAYGMREKDPRLLQFIGTDVFRRIDPDIWVRVLHDTIAEDRPRVVVLTDVRFPNEAEYIKRSGGYLAKVSRLTADGCHPFVAADRDPNHPSETALDDYTNWDFTVSTPSGKLYLLDAAASAIYHQATLRHRDRLDDERGRFAILD